MLAHQPHLGVDFFDFVLQKSQQERKVSVLHGKEHLCRFAIRAPLERPLAPPHGPFREILALHWKHKRDTILAQLRASRDNVIKYHGTAAARAHSGTRYLGGNSDAPSSNAQSTVVDSMIDDVRC